ncbi:hypothetical protein FACS1894192_07970 [Bacilli bacterium]|nr:hypothetical protein FACS1894192_07970 [Bacilli bacterium]
MKINGILQNATFIKVNGETVIELGIKLANSTNETDFFIVQKDFVNQIFLGEEIEFDYSVLQSGQQQSEDIAVRSNENSNNQPQPIKIDFESLYAEKTIKLESSSSEPELSKKSVEEPEAEVTRPEPKKVEKSESRESDSEPISAVSSEQVPEKAQKTEKKARPSGIAGLLEAASLFEDDDEEEGDDDDD